MDMSMTIAPKSDQLNSDDLIAGPRTITVTKVSGRSTPEQPVAISFEGDDGKPYLPCKSMRRVLVALWGPDAVEYAGRSMRLYRDPEVAFGGMKVGGIRISHLSHIDREHVLALTATKQSRKPFTVKPMPQQAKASGPTTFPVLAPSGQLHQVSPARWLAAVGKAVAGMEDAAALNQWCLAMVPHIAAVREVDDALAHQAEQLVDGRAAYFRGPPQDEPGATEPEDVA